MVQARNAAVRAARRLAMETERGMTRSPSTRSARPHSRSSSPPTRRRSSSSPSPVPGMYKGNLKEPRSHLAEIQRPARRIPQSALLLARSLRTRKHLRKIRRRRWRNTKRAT